MNIMEWKPIVADLWHNMSHYLMESPSPFMLKDCKSISCNGENIKKINYYIFCKLEFLQQNASFVTQ